MDRNVKIARELVRLAKSLVGIDLTFDVDNSGKDGEYVLSDRYWDVPNKKQDNPQETLKQMLDKAEKEGKKYILCGKEGDFWRIKACKNFGDVKKGQGGGVIESENNLSHEGNCWVYRTEGEDGVVYGNATVYGNAKVYGSATVRGNAKVYGNAEISGDALVYGDARVYENACVAGGAFVGGHAKIHGKAFVIHDVENGDITE